MHASSSSSTCKKAVQAPTVMAPACAKSAMQRIKSGRSILRPIFRLSFRLQVRKRHRIVRNTVPHRNFISPAHHAHARTRHRIIPSQTEFLHEQNRLTLFFERHAVETVNYKQVLSFVCDSCCHTDYGAVQPQPHFSGSCLHRWWRSGWRWATGGHDCSPSSPRGLHSTLDFPDR